MTAETIFKQDYEKHLQHLKLKGLQPKTIDAYSRGIRRLGEHFSHEINDLSEQQLADYFIKLLSISGVRHNGMVRSAPIRHRNVPE